MIALLHKLIDWSIRRRGMVLAYTIGFIIFSLWSIKQLRFDAFPDITNTQVQVVTSSAGLSSAEVEQLITLPIERSLGGVSGVIEQRSLSRAGVSSITVVFEEGTDLWRARQLVKERLDSARSDIPADAGEPELGPPSTGLGEVYQFTLQSDRHHLPELYRIFERDIAPRLRSISGVVEVNAWGGGRPQIDVVADSQKLLAHQVTWHELQESLERSIVRVSGGMLRFGSEQISVKAESQLIRPDMVGMVPIKSGILVRDVATISESGALTVGLGSNQAQGEALFVMVQLLAGADALKVVEELEIRSHNIKESLPEGVKFEVIYNRNKLIRYALSTVATSLSEGGILVMLVLLLLLGDLRAGLLVSSIIPLSLLGALAGLAWCGVSGNLMSLGAIDFGLVVDGAIVVTESIIAIKLTQGLSPTGLQNKILERTKRVAKPVSLAILILCLVYTPILSLWGTEGKLFRPMALTVLFALLVAFILSFTYVPALSTWLIKPKGDHQTKLMSLLSALYEPLLAKLINKVRLSMLMVISLLILSIFAFVNLGIEFVPRLEEGDLVIQTTRLASISPEQALKDASKLEKLLLTFPEVLKVSSRIGSAAVATDPMGLEQADVFIKLKPRDQWTSATNTEELTQAISQKIQAAELSGQIGFSQPIEMRFNEMLEGITADLGIKIFGPNLSTLSQIGAQIANTLEKIDGAVDVKKPDTEGLTSLVIKLNPALLDLYQLNAEQVAQQIKGLQRGIELGRVTRGQFQDPIVLKLKAPVAYELAQLPFIINSVPNQSRHTKSQQGSSHQAHYASLPLNSFAQIERNQVPVTIERETGSRRMLVQANIRGRDLGSFIKQAQDEIKAIELPPGYWLEWSGQYAQLQEASQNMMMIIPAVLLAIILLLYVSFQSFKLTLLISLNVPVAMSGGLITLWLSNTPLSLSAIVGCVALFGIAIMNGVVLLNRTQELQEEHPEWSSLAVAQKSAYERLRPVFSTALVAGLGFMPMALASGIGSEVQRPLALVVIGGLVTSTLLTLLTLPTFYAWGFQKKA